MAHKRYQTIKTAVHVIQDRWRATLNSREIQREFLIKKGAAITIQSWWRGYIVCKQYKRSCNSIVKLQAIVRRKLQQKSYKTLKSSAVIIQTHFRAYLVGKETRRKYSEMKESIVKLQALIRTYNARTLLKRIRSSVVIQSHYRRHICMRNYSQTRSAVIKIQSECRALIQRRSFQTKMKAIVKIQRYLKQKLFVKHIENYLEVRRKSAVQIQAWIRGNKDRKMVKRIKAAIVIQAAIKMNIQRRKFQHHRRRIIMVQSFVRKCLAQRKTDLLRKEHSAATCIQTAYRNFKQRQLLKVCRFENYV
jgi:abnormal spindle-like microcephaly-associated protein